MNWSGSSLPGQLVSSADENDRIAARDIPASPLSPDDFRLILETKSLQSKLRQTELDNQIIVKPKSKSKSKSKVIIQRFGLR